MATIEISATDRSVWRTAKSILTSRDFEWYDSGGGQDDPWATYRRGDEEITLVGGNGCNGTIRDYDVADESELHEIANEINDRCGD